MNTRSMKQQYRLFCLILAAVISFFVSCASTADVSKSAAAPSGPLVAELKVLDSATAPLWFVAEDMRTGKKQFADREFTVKSMPVSWEGAVQIVTAADSKKYSQEPLASFIVNEDAVVAAAHDTRVAVKPQWLSSWKNSGEVIINTESNPTSFALFTKEFKAGSTVVLGPNGQSGGCLMYMVLAVPQNRKMSAAPAVIANTAPVKKPDSGTAQKGRSASWPGSIGETDEWFSSAEALRLGDNLLAYQRNTGAWPKNIDMAKPLNEQTLADLAADKRKTNDSTIDNNATTQQIRYLSKLYSVTGIEKYKSAALAGIEYVLTAQYPNGGWPQFYPLDPKFYSRYITYNDDAMVNVMYVLEKVLNDKTYSFVDESIKERIRSALKRGVDVILASQIVINGKKTAWCAQHYPDTLLPAHARAYELPSISGQESVGIVKYLMSIESPSAAVIDAVQAAVSWFDSARLDGIVVKEISAPDLPKGRDTVVQAAANAQPVWGRFYDLETGKPFFTGRDGVKKETLAEIEHERRIGYKYYTNSPLALLVKDYPAWLKKNSITENVLKNKY